MSRPFRRLVDALAVLFLVAVPVVLGRAGAPFGHSLRYNLNWQFAYERALSAGTWLPRHLPDLWMGAGGLDFFFYGPLPFHCNALFVRPFCGSCEVGTVLGIGGGLAISASAVSFYVFARLFAGRTAAMIGAVFYSLLLPYHVVIDWAARQAAGEVFAYVFVPLMAYGIEGIFRGEKKGRWLALGLAGLIISHLPSALLALHVLGGVAFVRILLSGGDRAQKVTLATRLIYPVVVGGGLAAFYWLPAFVLLRDVTPSELYGEYFHAPNWLYGLSFDQPNVRWAKITLAALATPGLVVAVSVLSRFASMRRAAGLAWVVGPAALCWLLSLDIAYPFWRYWIVKKVQFPWRITQFADLSAALAVAVTLSVGRTRSRVAVALACLAITVAGSGWILSEEAHKLERAALSSPTESVFGALEYFPPPAFKAYFETKVEEGQIRRIAYAKRVQEEVAGVSSVEVRSRQITAVPVDGAREVRIPAVYWKHWRAEDSQGAPLVLEPVPQTGTMRVRREDGAALTDAVRVTLPLHWSEWAGAFISFVALLGLLLPAGALFLRAREPAA